MTTSRSMFPALALAAALAAAACGQGGGTASPATTAAGTPASSASPAPASASASPGAATPGAASEAASVAPSAPASAGLACTAPAAPTIAQTEGPYYKAGASQTGELATDAMPGTRLTFTGYVVDTSCTPVAGATVETWQADSAGVYDNTGYALRGWVLTDADGRFTVHTIVPGEYPGRTEHIHVKVTPPGGATLTSQMYFPGTAANDGDGIYDPSLLLSITEVGDALIGEYTFVVGG